MARQARGSEGNGSKAASTRKKGKRGAPQTFASKLFSILQGGTPIVGWSTEGEGQYLLFVGRLRARQGDRETRRTADRKAPGRATSVSAVPPPCASTRASFCVVSARRFFFPQASARCCRGSGIYWRKVALSPLLGLFFLVFFVPLQVYHSKNVFFWGYNGARAQRPTSPRLEPVASRRLRISTSRLCARHLSRRRRRVVMCAVWYLISPDKARPRVSSSLDSFQSSNVPAPE